MNNYLIEFVLKTKTGMKSHFDMSLRGTTPLDLT